MQVYVYGCSSAKREMYLTLASEFYASILLHPNMSRNIKIGIEIDKKLPHQGQVSAISSAKNPRSFLITIRGKATDADMFQTLAHEMVHVKQMAKNELRIGQAVSSGYTLPVDTIWKGVPYKFKKNEHPYYDSPWEIESMGREESLFLRWKAFLSMIGQ